uniref:Sulfatase N-terminal domain-containing protein n=1 Tax=Aplanochytrium stocchinoi TaxID=215587 RepID=A0A7S3PJ43_9STRA
MFTQQSNRISDSIYNMCECIYVGDVLSAVRIESRYKAMIYTTVWEEGYACPTATMCECVGNAVTKHDPPLLYDIRTDPGEENVLTADSFSKYDEIMEKVNRALEKHQKTIDQFPNQESQVKMTQTPLLLPHVCCDFPRSCQCNKETLHSHVLQYDP